MLYALGRKPLDFNNIRINFIKALNSDSSACLICLLPTAYCLLPTAYCLLPTAYSYCLLAKTTLITISTPRIKVIRPTFAAERMTMKQIFITGIGTDVGKTVVSAIVTEALKADYWKPVQSGLDATDRNTVQDLISNQKSVIHPERYRLKTPMSPHESARKDGVEIQLEKVNRPQTNNHLVIEGAGGFLVPLNDRNTIADLIQQDDQVILVSSGYLGSINHTLLTVEALKSRGLNCAGIIYNHVDLDGTIEIIEKMTGVPTLGNIEKHQVITSELVAQYASKFKSVLEQL